MATKPHDDGDTKTHDADRKNAASEHARHAARPPHVTGAASGATLVSERTPEQREAMAAASIGAQVILDYNGDGSIGARGGAGGTIEENTIARDAHLISIGLDPNAPSGPPTGEPWVPPAVVTQGAKARSGHATRMSSLAAGIITDADDLPTQPPGSNGTGGASGAPVNRDVPHVSQSGDTLNCTMGNWEGEPTSYGYQWRLDGSLAGTDAATYTAQASDVGKTATCVVTATNAHGSTAAPPSNEVTIADPAAGTTTSRSKK
jgi:hypothetical protein